MVQYQFHRSYYENYRGQISISRVSVSTGTEPQYRHILYFHIKKKYFFVHVLIYREVVICECSLHWHQIR